MDNVHAESSQQRSQHSSYSLRVLNNEEEEVWLPGLAARYMETAHLGLESAASVCGYLSGAIICLCLREEQLIGFVAFTDVGIRQAAQIHMAFWGTSTHRRRAELVRQACELVCTTFDLLRVEAYIVVDRPDIAQFAELVGGVLVGKIPSAYRDVYGVIQDENLYIYLRES